ncbi:MAG: hypothetical protein ABR911_12350 [Syntrophales bacterium]
MPTHKDFWPERVRPVLLGINPSTLRSKMKKLGIAYGRKRG